MERLHPESLRQLRDLVRLHGGEAVREATREIDRTLALEARWIGAKVKMIGCDTVYEVERVYLREGNGYLIASYQHAPNQRVGLDQPASAVVRVEG